MAEMMSTYLVWKHDKNNTKQPNYWYVWWLDHIFISIQQFNNLNPMKYYVISEGAIIIPYNTVAAG